MIDGSWKEAGGCGSGPMLNLKTDMDAVFKGYFLEGNRSDK